MKWTLYNLVFAKMVYVHEIMMAASAGESTVMASETMPGRPTVSSALTSFYIVSLIEETLELLEFHGL